MKNTHKTTEERITYNIWHQLTDEIDKTLLFSWEIKDIKSMSITDHGIEMPTVSFKMDGTNFTGTVLTAYNAENDSYSIYLIKNNTCKLFKTEKNIKLPQLQKQFVELVERPTEWSDEEYEFEQDAHIYIDIPKRIIEEMNEEAEKELHKSYKDFEAYYNSLWGPEGCMTEKEYLEWIKQNKENSTPKITSYD